MNRPADSNRLIVVHGCEPGKIEPGLFLPGDVLFFDDCLWSQYRFVSDNMDQLSRTKMVFGFSSGLARPECLPPIEYIDSAIAHDAVNAVMKRPDDFPPDQIRAFMSVQEVREIARLPNVDIALHGCMHLRLEQSRTRVGRLGMFRRDVEDGVRLLAEYGISSRIFVYPYAYCEDGYEYVVEKAGFRESYAKPGRYRIRVEALSDEHSVIADS